MSLTHQRRILLVDDDEAIMTSFHVLPARKKLDRWRELTKSKLNEPWQSHIVKVIDRAAGMQQERDRIVHGMWGQSGEQVATSTNPLDGKITAFKWTGSKPPFDWKLSYPQIDNVAGKIDLLIRDLFQTVIDAWGSPPPLFGDAIKKMRHS